MPKELTSNEHNAKVFAEIQKLEDKIAKLKDTLKPVELVENTPLHMCNQIARKQRQQAAQASQKALDAAFNERVNKALKEKENGDTAEA